MEGLNYESRLTYTYSKTQEEIKKILGFEYFQKCEFDDQHKIVEYVIDHSNCAKLSDLLYWIEQKFIRLHLYQIIHLCIGLVKKVDELKANQINHNYLSSDRIWLQLQPGSEKFKIAYSELYYTIHFTGYDCPFYEREDYNMYYIYDQLAIQEIIKQIFGIVEKSFRNQVKQKAKEKNIFDLLYNAVNKSLQEFQLQAINIIQKYKNASEQRLEQIDHFYNNWKTTNRRFRRSDLVCNNIQELTKQYYTPDEWQLFEILFYFTVPLFVQSLKYTFSYYEVKLPSNLQLHNFDREITIENYFADALIKNCTEKANAQLKFELEKDIKLQVVSQVSNIKRVLQYFYNNVEFRVNYDKKIISNQIIIMKQQKLEEVVNQIYDQTCDVVIGQFMQGLI